MPSLYAGSILRSLDTGFRRYDEGGSRPLLMWLCAVAVALAFDFPPRCLRRAPQRRSDIGSRLLARGEAGCRSVQRQARDGLSLDPAPAAEHRAPGHRASSFAMARRRLRGGVSWLLLSAVGKK